MSVLAIQRFRGMSRSIDEIVVVIVSCRYPMEVLRGVCGCSSSHAVECSLSCSISNARSEFYSQD